MDVAYRSCFVQARNAVCLAARHLRTCSLARDIHAAVEVVEVRFRSAQDSSVAEVAAERASRCAYSALEVLVQLVMQRFVIPEDRSLDSYCLVENEVKASADLGPPWRKCVRERQPERSAALPPEALISTSESAGPADTSTSVSQTRCSRKGPGKGYCWTCQGARASGLTSTGVLLCSSRGYDWSRSERFECEVMAVPEGAEDPCVSYF